jgi:hypothetical protein
LLFWFKGQSSLCTSIGPRMRDDGLLWCRWLVTAVFGMLAFVGHFAHLDMNLDGAILPSSERFLQFSVNRMSPLTGMLVCLAGIALLLLLRHKTQRSITHLAADLASLVAMAGLIATIAYVYGMPLLYVGTIIPMALTTSAAFMFLGTGLVAAAGPSTFLIAPLTGSSVRAMLLRTFVPLGFIAVIGSDILQHLVCCCAGCPNDRGCPGKGKGGA